MTVKELQEIWELEKDAYRVSEVGSGVQMFVKDVFASQEVFSLQKGRRSTKNNQRQDEFTEETSTKAGRKADLVIYINADIQIPVEVEKHGHIKAGEAQLKNYQTDLEKQYGILTDGNEWRFYNNNLYKSFFIDHILSEPELFLTFWRSYIQPQNYYVNFFEPLGQKKLFDRSQDLPVEENRQLFFKDITNLIDLFNKKLNIAGYLVSTESSLKPKQAVELSYAYIIQFILFKTLVDNEFGNFNEEFSERITTIKQALRGESYNEVLSAIQGISNKISHNIYRPFAKEQAIIGDVLQAVLDAPKSDLRKVEPWLDVFVFIKKYNFANVKNDIFGYIYENYLKDLYSDEQKGQYFTDPAVVNFMLDHIGYTPDEIKKRYQKDPSSISIIDPSCGSGTFLYSAADRIAQAFDQDSEASAQLIEDIVNKNVFGLDIEEFPLYLAEMNILMRLLPFVVHKTYNNPIDKKIKVFWTKDSLAEFQDTSLRNTLFDHSVAWQKAGERESVSLFSDMSKKLDFGYTSYVRDEDDLAEMKRSLEEKPGINTRQRFDYVIGNPPYVTYNECSKQGILFIRLIQSKEASMGDVYGVNLNTVPNRIKAYAPKPNLYAFFTALGLALLKDGGKLCYIIPQTLLTSMDHDVLRYHLAKFMTIESIVIPESKMFIGRGLRQDKPVATSSLIITLIKKEPSAVHSVEVILHVDANSEITESLDNISNRKKVRIRRVPQVGLVKNVGNWNYLKFSPSLEELVKEYNQKETIDIYRLPQLSKYHFNSKFYFDKGLVFAKNKIITYSSADNYLIPSLPKTGFSLRTTSQSVSAENIKLPKGAQGFKVYDQPYKIVWSYMNPRRMYFSSKRIMVSFNYILITSDSRNEILFLLSLLNANLNWALYQAFLRSGGEKDFLLGIKFIKEFVRVPAINKDNQHIKKEVIKQTQTLLDLEKDTLADLVDFSGLMQQKFDSLEIKGSQLVLTRGDKNINCKITGSPQLVEKRLADANLKEQMDITYLKNLPIINLEEQVKTKAYIDDLVFALYFNIKLPDTLSFSKAGAVRSACAAHKFYKLVDSSKG